MKELLFQGHSNQKLLETQTNEIIRKRKSLREKQTATTTKTKTKKREKKAKLKSNLQYFSMENKAN